MTKEYHGILNKKIHLKLQIITNVENTIQIEREFKWYFNIILIYDFSFLIFVIECLVRNSVSIIGMFEYFI